MEPSDRPYILLNYAMSLDGKLSTKDRDPVNFTSKKDRDLMDQIRSEVDAVLIGAGTLRAENPPVRIRKGDRRRERVNSNKQPHPISILLSRNLCFPTNGRYWTDCDIERIIVTTKTAPPKILSSLKAKTEIIQIGDSSVDIKNLCKILLKRGISRLLIEGGGDVNMAFWEAGLVDEVLLTLCPVVIGGKDAPTGADGVGFENDCLARLTLVETNKIGEELFLRYRKDQ